jgi:hypothetical protein
MSVIHCPNCGRQCPDAEIRGETPFQCPGCGKTIEPSIPGNNVPKPPLQSKCSASDRWSEGPPPDSANRWSAEAPFGDDSFSSDSISQSSISQTLILPDGGLEQPVIVPPRRLPLLWALIALVLLLIALIGAVILARLGRPWGARQAVGPACPARSEDGHSWPFPALAGIRPGIYAGSMGGRDLFFVDSAVRPVYGSPSSLDNLRRPGSACRVGLLCSKPPEKLRVARSGSAQWSLRAERTYRNV